MLKRDVYDWANHQTLCGGDVRPLTQEDNRFFLDHHTAGICKRCGAHVLPKPEPPGTGVQDNSAHGLERESKSS